MLGKNIRHVWYIIKTQIKLIEIKTIISEMENTLHGIHSRLDIAKERVSEIIPVGTIQHEIKFFLIIKKNAKHISEQLDNFK